MRKFGKTALIAAVAGSCGYLSAATLTIVSENGSTNVSLEGAAAATAGTTVALSSVVLTFGDQWAAGDRVRLSLTGGSFATYIANAPSISCTDTDFVFESPALTSASGSAEFFVNAVSGTPTSIGTVCTFASLAVLASSISSAGTVTMTAAKTVGVADSAAAATVFTVQSQVANISVLSALNGVVDYQNSLGLGFAAGDGGITTGTTDFNGNGDQLTLEVSSINGLWLSTTSNLSLSFAITAQSGKTFAFLDDAGACGTSARLNRSTSNGRLAATANTSVTINAACNEITWVGTVGPLTGTARTVSLQFGNKQATPSTGTVVIEPMTFPTFLPSLQQAGVNRGTITALSPGSWTSNGSTVQIPYMPVNSTAGAGKIDPVIIVSNRSAATGAISAVLRDESGNTCSVTDSVLGSVAGNRTKSIGGLIRDAAAGAGCPTLNAAGGEKLSITLTVTLPSGSTEVYSGYTVGGTSRVTVVNSSNGVPNP